MLVHCDVSGFYDWVPVPEDVEITDEDKASGAVKLMQDDEWYARVAFDKETHHDANIPEEAICRRLAALEFLGKRSSREEAVVEILRSSFEYHLDLEHLVKISVTDSGADPALYEKVLIEYGVPEERRAAAHYRYEDGVNVERYLNVVFKTEASRK